MSISDHFRECSTFYVSFSMWATVNLTDFRNGGPQPEDQKDEVGCCRKITTELGYAALLLVSVIEFVVRAILSLIAVPLLFIMSCLDCPGMGFVANASFSGAFLTGENIVNLVTLLFTNFCEDYVSYDQIAGKFADCNREINKSINACYGGKLNNT